MLTRYPGPGNVRDMTKTEAAEILALRVRVEARRMNRTIDKAFVEDIAAEAAYWTGLLPQAAAARPSWRTILRLATSDL